MSELPDQAVEPGLGPDTPFEELQRELDRIVETLERGEVHVDEAIRLWQRGEALYRACAARLEAAELRIEELTGTAVPDDNGPPTV